MDIPSLAVAIPAGARTRKAIWSKREVDIELPEFSGDVTEALSFRANADAERTTVYRVEDAHYRRSEFRKSAFDRNPSTNFRDERELLHKLIMQEATTKASLNIGPDIKPYPDNAWPTRIEELWSRLPRVGQTDFRDEDEETGVAFKSHMDRMIDNFVLIDGMLHERCHEPTYAVVALGGTAVSVRASLDTMPSHYESVVALFPLGRLDHAISFARLVAEETGAMYGETQVDMEDCGECLVDDAAERTLVLTARSAVKCVKDHYAPDFGGNPMASTLLNDVPLEDIRLYRNLRDSVEAYDKGEYFNPEEIAFSLREATNSRRAAMFSGNSRVPLAAIADLWDDRPVAAPTARFPSP